MTHPSIVVCPETPSDVEAIDRVLRRAFPTDLEARLVTALRAAGHLTISLVATCNGEVVGHIAFSPITLDAVPEATGWGLGLAPLAVLPELQNQGIGSRLAAEGLAACEALGQRFAVVLGEPHYYARFGFTPAARWNLFDEYDGGMAFQAIEWIPGAIPQAGALIRYAPEFRLFADPDGA